jgi:hypothetical protein
MPAAIVALLMATAPLAQAAASAIPSTSGNGKTHLGASFGFTAQANLHGEIQFNNGTLKVHCKGLHGYHTDVNDKGFNDATFASYNCEDRAGNLYRVWIDAVDQGEPGITDKVAIRIRDSSGNLLVDDRGRIQTGNVQVKI